MQLSVAAVPTADAARDALVGKLRALLEDVPFGFTVSSMMGAVELQRYRRDVERDIPGIDKARRKLEAIVYPHKGARPKTEAEIISTIRLLLVRPPLRHRGPADKQDPRVDKLRASLKEMVEAYETGHPSGEGAGAQPEKQKEDHLKEIGSSLRNIEGALAENEPGTPHLRE